MTDWDIEYFKETIPFCIFMFGFYLIIMALVTFMYVVFREDDVFYKTVAPVVDLTPAKLEKLKNIKAEDVPLQSI